MVVNEILDGEKIYLRQIEEADCTKRYVEWLNDSEVNQYLETKWSIQNLETIKAFVRQQRKCNDSILWAIVYRGRGSDEDIHIGNIKIGPIHPHYRHGDISYFIGDKQYYNKGIATEAVHLVTEYGFQKLHLHRIEAGCYAVNTGSNKVLEKNGFKRDAVFHEQVLFDGRYMDVYRFSVLEDEWH